MMSSESRAGAAGPIYLLRLAGLGLGLRVGWVTVTTGPFNWHPESAKPGPGPGASESVPLTTVAPWTAGGAWKGDLPLAA